jgi:hypothetical protein
MKFVCFCSFSFLYFYLAVPFIVHQSMLANVGFGAAHLLMDLQNIPHQSGTILLKLRKLHANEQE